MIAAAPTGSSQAPRADEARTATTTIAARAADAAASVAIAPTRGSTGREVAAAASVKDQKPSSPIRTRAAAARGVTSESVVCWAATSVAYSAARSASAIPRIAAALVTRAAIRTMTLPPASVLSR
jgi:hypothetical protein